MCFFSLTDNNQNVIGNNKNKMQPFKVFIKQPTREISVNYFMNAVFFSVT